MCGRARPCIPACHERWHVQACADARYGLCGYVRGRDGCAGGHVRPAVRTCAGMCGRARPLVAERPRTVPCAGMCGAMCGHVRAEPEQAALAWAPNASPKRRPYCTRVSAHATHMGAQSQTSSHGEDRMGTSVKNSEHMPPHMPAHTRASMDRCAPTAGTPAHAGHMPRTCPHNERTCRAKNAGTYPETGSKK